jgi:Arc/MetJ family transcription regulator
MAPEPRRVGPSPRACYSFLMKRTNLVLDEQLLQEVTKVSGETSYSRAVTRAMEEFLRRHRAEKILDLAGSGLWEGDLAEMRRDSTLPTETRTRPRAPR